MAINSSIESLYWLSPDDDEVAFPPVDLALREPDGLLAFGGSLSVQRLLHAYQQGIFPWYSEGQPIMWWSPDPRMVLFPADLKVSRSLRKTLKKKYYTLTLDTAFAEVVEACAAPRKDDAGTWITDDMKNAYKELYRQGHAHSVEVWLGEELVGGLYGVAIGTVFFGESMFARRSDTSKLAFVYLVQQLKRWGYSLIDCQVYSAHLASLGAINIPRAAFVSLLNAHCHEAVHGGHTGPWQFDNDFQVL
ncbi:leucyl/phenylalanyl-tRNA--protein transferase [Sulfuriflexus mobilis]|uniref:leucyl/phenylalanyl-tRNA--protein transferase n=1 Tax=Sulfuriflexus mobilis TaxID=1811807 RepID=UPI000F8429C9